MVWWGDEREIESGSFDSPQYTEVHRAGRPLSCTNARLLAIAPAVLPQEALAMGEVVGPVGVHPVLQPRAVAPTPDALPAAPPGIAQVQVPVDMNFVRVDQDDLPAADALEQLQQLLDV